MEKVSVTWDELPVLVFGVVEITDEHFFPGLFPKSHGVVGVRVEAVQDRVVKPAFTDHDGSGRNLFWGIESVQGLPVEKIGRNAEYHFLGPIGVFQSKLGRRSTIVHVGAEFIDRGGGIKTLGGLHMYIA